MPAHLVKNLPLGVKLAEDVHTSLGGLLLPKGTIIMDKELEILHAFLVDEVVIEEDIPKPESEHVNKGEAANRKSSKSSIRSGKGESDDFTSAYQTATGVFRQLWLQVQGGQGIPVLAVRETITPLLPFVCEQPSLMFTLAKMTHPEDYLYQHAIAAGLISYAIARWLKLPEKEWMQIALAGALMDIGKTKIHPKILWKPDKLTPEEFEEMKMHTMYGYQLIKAAPGLNEGVALAALQHHEREDCSGYPLGLSGNRLHIYAKIVAVADVFHAMSSNRVYQKAASPYFVVEQLLTDCFGKLDPTIVHTFVNGITQFAVGTVVELSNGAIGKIIFTDRSNPTRPMIETNGRIINLAQERNVSILRVVSAT